MTIRLTSLFRQWSGSDAIIAPLQAHASPRQIYRLTEIGGSRTAIGVIHNDDGENRAFVSFARTFRALGLPVPEIYAENLREHAYLQEDLGDETLLLLLKVSGFTPAVEAIYAKVLTQLSRFQFQGGKKIDYSVSSPVGEHGYDALLWDLRYFKESFLRRSSVSFDSALLDKDLEGFARHLSNLYSPSRDGDIFMYRDFQARNIMVRKSEPFFIDFQSGRRGAPYFDVAMLLYQVSANISPEARVRLLDHYFAAIVPFMSITREELSSRFHAFALGLLLHHFGTYGRFGIGARQPYFLDSLVKAPGKLRALLTERSLPIVLPELSRIFKEIVAFEGKEVKDMLSPTLLKITVKSFSYKKGGVPVFPLDDSQGSRSGGGFIFDCRCLPNPGREAAYKIKTGRDPEVIQYLENIPAVVSYRNHVLGLVKIAVENYLERGFTDLVFGFGCTGGQHRSVYFSEFIARHLFMNYPVQVTLSHRELGI